MEGEDDLGEGKALLDHALGTAIQAQLERVTWARGRPRPQAGTALLPRSSLPALSQAVWAGAPLGPGLGFHLCASWTEPFRLSGLGGSGQLLHLVQRGLKARPQSLGWTDQKAPFWGTLAYLCLWLSPGCHYHALCPTGLTSYCEVAAAPVYLDQDGQDSGSSNMLRISHSILGSPSFCHQSAVRPQTCPLPSPLWASEFPSETPGWSRRSSGSYSNNASSFDCRGLVLRIVV